MCRNYVNQNVLTYYSGLTDSHLNVLTTGTCWIKEAIHVNDDNPTFASMLDLNQQHS